MKIVYYEVKCKYGIHLETLNFSEAVQYAKVFNTGREEFDFCVISEITREIKDYRKTKYRLNQFQEG